MPALSYDDNPNVMIVGVGLMGQYLASRVGEWLGPAKLVLVDGAEAINVGGARTALSDFAQSNAAANPSLGVVAEAVDVTSEDAVAALFSRHGNIRYLQHTAGISPRPLTPPEELGKEDILRACEVNLWGAHNVLKQGIRARAFAPRTHGVLILSTSATAGSEGRASAAYEVSKGGLLNLLTLQARYFLEAHGLVLNGLAPSPLRGPMAAQNDIGAGRLQAVADSMPMGRLTDPSHIAAATMYFWSNECWCVDEVLTVDGGYTKHKPIDGALRGRQVISERSSGRVVTQPGITTRGRGGHCRFLLFDLETGVQNRRRIVQEPASPQRTRDAPPASQAPPEIPSRSFCSPG